MAFTFPVFHLNGTFFSDKYDWYSLTAESRHEVRSNQFAGGSWWGSTSEFSIYQFPTIFGMFVSQPAINCKFVHP